MRIIKTVEVKPNSLHHRIVAAIMAKMQLKEVQRVVVGGHMSEVMIVITFEGGSDDWQLFKNKYIEIPSKNPGYSAHTFYSFDILEGFTGTRDAFKAQIKLIRAGQTGFEFKELEGL